jgi:hypothetical protein
MVGSRGFYIWMYRDRWMAGGMDGWTMGRWMEVWIEGLMYGKMERWMDG